MAQHNSRFNEYLPGDSPGDFSPLWAGGGTFTKEYNHVDRLSNLTVTGTGASWSAITPDTLSSSTSGMTAIALIVPGATASPTIGVCLGGSTSSENGIYLKVDPVNGQVDFRELASGVDSSITPSIGTNPISGFGFEGVPIWLELSYVNAGGVGVWGVRVWNLGTSRSSGSTASLSDTAFGGVVGLMTNASTDDYRVLSFSAVDNIVLGHVVAFEEIDLTQGSLSMLADESDNISAFVSVDVHDPGTSTTTTNHYGMLPHADILGDGVGVSGGLSIESSAGYSLIGDKYLDTQADKTYQLKLHNPPIDGDAGIYDTLAGKSTDGRLARLKLGSVDLEPRLWSPYMSGRIIGEPAIDTQDNVALLTVGSATKAALNKQFPVPRYFGQRTWLETLTSSGGLVTVPHDATLALEAFTLVALVNPAVAAGRLINKYANISTDNNYALFILGASTLRLAWSSGGSLQVLTSATSVVDGEPHIFVASLLPGVHAYIMMDGEILDEDSSPLTPDTGNTANLLINDAAPVGRQIGHAGVLGAYTPPEQARSQFASRMSGSEPNMVGLWRLDDETGSTATDYSANGNDGTIAGTEGVNWDYVASDLGEPELAGRTRPLILGVPRQTLTHRSDYLRDRITHNYTETVDTDEDFRLKGVSTAETSNSDGVAEFGSSVSESLPITVDHANNGGATEDPDNWLVSEIAETIITTAGLEIGNPNELITQAPLQAGIAFDTAPTYLSMLNATLTESGMCWYEDAYGRIVTSRLMTPISPGPVETYCVESLGDPDRNATTTSRGLGPIVIGSVQTFPGADPDITLAGWVRPLHLNESEFDLGSGREVNTFFELGEGFYVGINMLTGALVGGFEGDSIEADSNAIDWGEWNYVAATFNFFPGAMGLECTMTLFVKPLGGSAASVASETLSSSSYSVTTTALHIGGVAGGYQRVSYVYGNLSAANLDSLSEDTDPLTNWDVGCHVWLNEGNASNYSEAVAENSDFSSAPVYLHRCRWAPKAILDLNQSTAEWDEGPNELRPADEFITAYDRAWHLLSDSDVAGSIKDTSTGDPSLYTQLTQRNKELRIGLQTITDNYLDAFRVEYDTPIVTKKGAEEISKYAQLRWQAGRIRGVLSNLDRRFVAVAPMDEILLQSTRPSGMFPRSVRVYDIEFQKWDGRGPKFRAKVTG